MNETDLLKREVFSRLMEISGRVFILVRHSEKVIIGHRGFSEDEKQSGITLVFNRNMGFTWDDGGISATLSFGSTAEKCVIPSSDIMAISSPDAGIQMLFDPQKADALHAMADPLAKEETSEKEKGEEAENDKKAVDPEEKVIRVDFKKRDD